MTQMTTTPTTSTPVPPLLPAPASVSVPVVPASSIAASTSSTSYAVPPRARALFEFCTQIVICATLSLMTWIGAACLTRDPGLKRFRQLKRYVDLTIKVLWTVRDKPERLTPAQLSWLRRAAETITHLFGRPLDFSPLDALTDPAKSAKPAPDDPDRPGPKRPAQRRSASSDYCPPVPDSLDAKYVQAPGQVLATVCANLVRLMGAHLPIQPVRDAVGQELVLAQKSHPRNMFRCWAGPPLPAPSLSLFAQPPPHRHPPSPPPSPTTILPRNLCFFRTPRSALRTSTYQPPETPVAGSWRIPSLFCLNYSAFRAPHSALCTPCEVFSLFTRHGAPRFDIISGFVPTPPPVGTTLSL